MPHTNRKAQRLTARTRPKISDLAGRIYDEAARTNEWERPRTVGLAAITRGAGVEEPVIKLFIGGMPRTNAPKPHGKRDSLLRRDDYRKTRVEDRAAVEMLNEQDERALLEMQDRAAAASLGVL